MNCTKCGLEQDILVALVNDRRLCPACVKAAEDNDLIEQKLRTTPELRRVMMQRYRIAETDKGVPCCMCRTQSDSGLIVKGLVLCLACAGRWHEGEMKELISRLDDLKVNEFTVTSG